MSGPARIAALVACVAAMIALSASLAPSTTAPPEAPEITEPKPLLAPESVEMAPLDAAWRASNPAAALLALLAKPPGRLRTMAITELVGVWAAHDPERAAAAMLGLELADERDRGLGQAVAVWAASDARAAVEWLDRSGDERARWHAAEAYAVWAATDATAAARHAVRRGADDRSMEAVLVAWSRTDPVAAYSFFSTELTGDQQRRVAPSLLLAVAVSEAPAIADGLLGELLAGSPASEDLAQLGKSLALVDAHLAMRVADAIPEGPEKASLRRTIEPRLFPVERSLPVEVDVTEGGDTVAQDFSASGTPVAAATRAGEVAAEGAEALAGREASAR